MGKRGPIPVPTAQKKLAGNPGRRPLPENEVTPDLLRTLPKPPSFLRAEAKKHWKVLGAQLAANGLLTDLDLDALAACCNAYATWIKAQRELNKEMCIVSPKGFLMPSPYIGIAEKALARLLRYQQEFGLTPAARARFEVEGVDEGDEFNEFLDEMEGTHG